jgi:hypothetical protein
MQFRLDQDEAHSLMSVITAYVIDHGGLSQDGKQAVRKWRTDRAEGSEIMRELTAGINEALGLFIEERTDRTVRRSGRYAKASEVKR